MCELEDSEDFGEIEKFIGREVEIVGKIVHLDEDFPKKKFTQLCLENVKIRVDEKVFENPMPTMWVQCPAEVLPQGLDIDQKVILRGILKKEKHWYADWWCGYIEWYELTLIDIKQVKVLEIE